MNSYTYTGRLLIVLLALLGGVLQSRGQWITQTVELKQGWNAVFLHVDASHATLDDLVGPGAPELTPIEQVWRWNPALTTGQYFSSPQEPVQTGTQWTSWKRSDSSLPRLDRLTGNTAYLVYSTANYTLRIKGQPLLPTYRWSTSGLNFLGFPSVTNAPPNFSTFFGPARGVLTGDIFRYPGGELGPGNPEQIFNLNVPVRRGEAFWMRAGDLYNNYYGPFEVVGAAGGRVAFGDGSSIFSFRLRNLTTNNLTVSLRLAASETPPAGGTPIAGLPPLLLRGERNLTNLTYAYSQIVAGTPHSWTLAPRGQQGSEAEVVLGLDRGTMSGNVGDLLAGVLQLTDSLGHTHIDMGVSATVASDIGLWLGSAVVTQVAQYLKTYEREGDNLKVDSSGAYVVAGVDTNINAVAAAYPLRLIVHNPSAGSATLLQRVYHGFNVAAHPVVATKESALARDAISQARRLSATHLPWTELNSGWDFTGRLSRSAQPVRITATVTNQFNEHASNPFLHTYHPDHDNLDARFKQELPQGSESYTVVREITLIVRPPASDFASRVSAGATFAGDYEETIRVLGLARAGNTFDSREFVVRGAFKVTRISEVPTLTRVP